MIVKLTPAVKSCVWGGERLIREWGKPSGTEPLGECWELSMHPGGPCRVGSGPHGGALLSACVKPEDLGPLVCRFPSFPVLVKLIDAKEDLSVQVHPDDRYAWAHEGQWGKTELWYILRCDPGAAVYLGFRETVSPDRLQQAAGDGRLPELLNRVPVRPGDSIWVPAGTVHAIGAGITLAEVQQNSDLTYRIYDYGRRDSAGNLRPLHWKQAAETATLQGTVPVIRHGEGLLGRCPYFSAYACSGSMTLRDPESFTALLAVDGELSVNRLHLRQGETAFVSAGEAAEVRGGRYLLVTVEAAADRQEGSTKQLQG